MLTAVDKGKRK